MQGTIKSVAVKLKNGLQDTWEREGTTYYKFDLVITVDGKDLYGDAMAKKPEAPWKIGDVRTFEMTSREHNGQTYNSFKSIKDPNSTFGGGGGGYKKPDPSFIIQKCFEGAVECTLAFFELNQDFYKSQEVEDKMLSLCYTHILGAPGTTESRRWINLSALRLTIAKMRANGLFEKGDASISSWFFSTATAIANAMEVTVKATVDAEAQPAQS